MRIAQVAPLVESVPPEKYGGTERVVSYLTEELVRMGHDVTLFASGDSRTSAKLVPCCKTALWRDPNCVMELPHYVRQLELVFRDLSRFDVVHFHTEPLHFPLLRRMRCPSVTTLHGRLDLQDLKPLFDQFVDIPVVSISNEQRKSLPKANWQATVYHGLPCDLHRFHSAAGDYLAFLGRAAAEKGMDRAIAIACAAEIPLKIAARIRREEQEYYDRVIKPLIARCPTSVEFIGEVGGQAKDDFLGRAKATLFPIDWPEPFGLVMIESLACGTPVVAWRNGSVPEVVDEGITGYIVESIDEGVDAVRRVDGLDRQMCRQVFEVRFDATRMADDYLAVYRRLLDAENRHFNGHLPRRRAARLPAPKSAYDRSLSVGGDASRTKAAPPPRGTWTTERN